MVVLYFKNDLLSTYLIPRVLQRPCRPVIVSTKLDSVHFERTGHSECCKSQ